MSPFVNILIDVIGYLALYLALRLLIDTLHDFVVGLRAHVFSRFSNKKFVERYGKWAVVTGCTGGIGRAYAEELAKEGLNLVLISLYMEDLKKVESELRRNYGIETEVVEVDFQDGRPLYEIILKHLEGKDIGMLINNVGIMHKYPDLFHKVSDEIMWGMVNINAAAGCAMTKLVLPQMLTRGRGAIINIGSASRMGPMPLAAEYAASKAFVNSLSLALEREYRSKGITIQAVNPLYVSTDMTKYMNSNPSIIFPTASVFVSHAINTIGYTNCTSGYWLFGIQAWFIERFVPQWVFILISWKFMGLFTENKAKDD